MQVSKQELISVQEAQTMYEWSQNYLVRKSDGSVVADVTLIKGIWVARSKSGKATTKIGGYTEESSARLAVELHFGLRLHE